MAVLTWALFLWKPQQKKEVTAALQFTAKNALHSVLTRHDVTKATFTLQALVFNYDLLLRSNLFVSV